MGDENFPKSGRNRQATLGIYGMFVSPPEHNLSPSASHRQSRLLRLKSGESEISPRYPLMVLHGIIWNSLFCVNEFQVFSECRFADLFGIFLIVRKVSSKRSRQFCRKNADLKAESKFQRNDSKTTVFRLTSKTSVVLMMRHGLSQSSWVER